MEARELILTALENSADGSIHEAAILNAVSDILGYHPKKELQELEKDNLIFSMPRFLYSSCGQYIWIYDLRSSKGLKSLKLDCVALGKHLENQILIKENEVKNGGKSK